MRGGGFIREVRLLTERIEDPRIYPYSIPAVRGLAARPEAALPIDPGMTILVGENGSGKSTLIEAIAIVAGLNAEGGTRNFQFAQRPTESELHHVLDLIRNPTRERSSFFLRAETMFNVLTQVERLGLREYGWEDMHARSHGEAFLWIVNNRLHGNGLYVFDEPESALSPQRQLSLLCRMHDLIGRGAQIIMATHAPLLMAYPNALIYQLDEEGIAPVRYEDTTHYIVTRAFLRDPKRMLDQLLSDD